MVLLAAILFGVSSTARGLVEDHNLRFESRGAQHLKGLPTPLEIFALVD